MGADGGSARPSLSAANVLVAVLSLVLLSGCSPPDGGTTDGGATGGGTTVGATSEPATFGRGATGRGATDVVSGAMVGGEIDCPDGTVEAVLTGWMATSIAGCYTEDRKWLLVKNISPVFLVVSPRNVLTSV